MLRKSETEISDLEPLEDPGKVSGFQSPADDYREDRLNICERLVADSVNTYYFESDSDEMELFGIKKGTVLIVDRSLLPQGGRLVIVWNEGKWMVRQLITLPDQWLFTTGRENEPPIRFNEKKGMLIWGVVTWSCSPQIEKKKQSKNKKPDVRPR